MTEPPPIDPSSMSYQELQKACKDAGLPAKGNTAVLRTNLEDYVKDPEGTKARLGVKKKTREGWVDWKNHPARDILMEDLLPDAWLYGQDTEDAKDVYKIYQRRQKEFKDVPFDKFAARYKDSLQQAKKWKDRAAKEQDFLNHDRLLHPRQSHNHRGEPVFDMDTTAKKQLSRDIKNKLHKQMTPMELWEGREVYRKYKLSKFRPRIYQEIRRLKFINYLEYKRTEKRKEFAAKKAAKKAAKVVTFIRN